MNPDDVFDCKPLGCKGMKASACITRQEATFNRNGGVVFQPCGSGQCEQGRAVKLSMPKDWKAPAYTEWKPPGQLRSQRAAQRQYEREQVEQRVPTMDRPPLPDFRRELAAAAVAPPARGVGHETGGAMEKLCICGCGKPVAKVGTKGFRCRVRDGETRPGATRGALAPTPPPAPPPTFVPLPDPSTLPTEYLKACVIEAALRLHAQGKAA